MSVDVCVPGCDIGLGDCFDFNTHFELGHGLLRCTQIMLFLTEEIAEGAEFFMGHRPSRLALRSIAGRFTQVDTDVYFL